MASISPGGISSGSVGPQYLNWKSKRIHITGGGKFFYSRSSIIQARKYSQFVSTLAMSQ